MYHMFCHLLMTLFAVRGGYPKWRCAIHVVINYPHHCKIRWVADIAPNGKVTTEFLFYVWPVAHPLTSRTCCFFPVWLVTCLSFHISSDVSAIFGWFAAVVPLPTNNTALMGASRRGRSWESTSITSGDWRSGFFHWKPIEVDPE